MKICPICGAEIIAENVYSHKSIVCYYAEDLTDFEFLISKKYIIFSKDRTKVEMIYYLRRRFLATISRDLNSVLIELYQENMIITYKFSSKKLVTKKNIYNNDNMDLQKAVELVIKTDDSDLKELFVLAFDE